jgi:hypothetical protein
MNRNSIAIIFFIGNIYFIGQLSAPEIVPIVNPVDT